MLLAACGGAAAPASSVPAASPNAAAPAAVSASAKPAASASTAAAGKPAAAVSATGESRVIGGDPQGYPIRIGYASPAVASWPFYAALSQGLFAEQHLNVTMIQMPPNVAIPAL